MASNVYRSASKGVIRDESHKRVANSARFTKTASSIQWLANRRQQISVLVLHLSSALPPPDIRCERPLPWWRANRSRSNRPPEKFAATVFLQQGDIFPGPEESHT